MIAFKHRRNSVVGGGVIDMAPSQCGLPSTAAKGIAEDLFVGAQDHVIKCTVTGIVIDIALRRI
jgi:hypothetical protein